MTQEIQLIFNEVEKFYLEKDLKKDTSLSEKPKNNTRNNSAKKNINKQKNK